VLGGVPLKANGELLHAINGGASRLTTLEKHVERLRDDQREIRSKLAATATKSDLKGAVERINGKIDTGIARVLDVVMSVMRARD
jgi:hypothetical protein